MNSKIRLFLAALTLVPFARCAEPSEFAKVIQITPSSAQAPNAVSLSDFPVLVRLNAAGDRAIAGFSYADFRQAGGADLLFADETGRRLSHEIQVWDPSGESLVWVKVPQLTPASTVNMYYGHATAESANAPTNVWSSYSVVLHFDDDTSVPADDGNRYVTNAANGAVCRIGSSSTNVIDGVAGEAGGSVLGTGWFHNYTPGFSGNFGVILPSASAMGSTGTVFTLSGWLLHEGSSYNWDHLLFAKNDFGSWQGSFGVQTSDNGSQLLVTGNGDWNSRYYKTAGFPNDAWFHFGLVMDYQSVTHYVNGAAQATGSIGSSSAFWTSDYRIVLGEDSDRNSGCPWRGGFDEIRFRLAASSAEWIAAERVSVSDPAALVYSAATSPESTPPVFASAPAVVRNADGSFTVSASLSQGNGQLFVSFNGGDYQAFTDDVVESGVAYAKTFSASDLGEGLTVSVALKAVSRAGTVVMAYAAENLLTGAVTVRANGDVSEETLSASSFTFTRPETATVGDLTVRYAVTGTAPSGFAYEALSGTVVIPSGAASADVALKPLSDFLTDDDSTVVVTVADGLYAHSDDSASITIANCRRGEIWKFSRRLPITVGTKTVGGETVSRYPGTADVANVPVLVRFREGENGFRYSDFRFDVSSGLDLAFADRSGLTCDYEIDTWNTNGESLVWVKLPKIGPATEFYAFYGAASAGVTTPSAVWDGYIGVWHMGESGDGVLTVADSTSARRDGTTTENSLAVADGMIGAARAPAHLSGTSGLSHILVPCDAAIANARENLTISFWARLVGGESWAYLIGHKRRDDWDSWALQFNGSQNVSELRFWRENGDYVAYGMGSPFAANVWRRITAVYHGSYRSLYVDGVCVIRENNNWNWVQWNDQTGISIGGACGDDTWGAFNGDMDEVRLTTAVISDDQEALEYAMETDADFFSLGSVVLQSNDKPSVNAPEAVTADGEVAVSVTMPSGTGRVYLVLTDAAGASVTNELTAGEAVTGPQTFVEKLSSTAGLASGAAYTAAAFALGADGAHDEKSAPATMKVVNATATLEKVFDAHERNLTKGRFRIALAGGATASEALAIAYSVSGTAVAGTDYAALSGSATIAKGANAVDIDVTPILNEASDASPTLVLALASANCSLVATPVTLKIGDTDDYLPFARRKSFRASRYAGDALAGFPALIRLTPADGGFSYADLTSPSDGGDIWFADEQGNELPFEIDTWNPTGTSLVWVRVPSLEPNVRIRLCYGGTRIDRTVRAAEVWSEYSAVWHLNESSSGWDVKNVFADATGHGNLGTNHDTADAEGVIGGSRRISASGRGSADWRRIDVTYSESSKAWLNPTDSVLTVSVWMKYPVQDVGYDRIMSTKSNWDNSSGWEVTLVDGQPRRLDCLAGGSTGGGEGDIFPEPVNDEVWRLLTVVYSNDVCEVFLNGASVGTRTISPIQYSNRQLRLGHNAPDDSSHNSVSFKGWLDEARLIRRAIPAARLKAEYDDVMTASGLFKPSDDGLVVILR